MTTTTTESTEMSLTIRVYSDYVWPFCYLAEFPLAEAVRGRDVTVEWMPFELRPYPNPALRPEGEYLQRAWSQSVYPAARRLGVPIQLPPGAPQPPPHLAWEGYQFAKEHRRGNEYSHRVLEAFFVEGLDIGRPEVLTRLAGEVGLDTDGFGRPWSRGGTSRPTGRPCGTPTGRRGSPASRPS